MSTRIYKVRPDRGFLAWLQVHISTTRKEMSRHAEKWSSRRNIPIAFSAVTAGLCQGAVTREFPSEGSAKWNSDYFADVYLNERDLRHDGVEIVPHECLHAALVYERQISRFGMDYSGTDDEGMEHEERLCYTHGRICRGVMNAIAQHRKAAKRKLGTTARRSGREGERDAKSGT